MQEHDAHVERAVEESEKEEEEKGEGVCVCVWGGGGKRVRGESTHNNKRCIVQQQQQRTLIIVAMSLYDAHATLTSSTLRGESEKGRRERGV